ncbi:MAG: type 1 fimbrial protein [Neisseriaceae bacterium]|nr:type 1 fimbrial protein [Neisseriaceae bacterium]
MKQSVWAVAATVMCVGGVVHAADGRLTVNGQVVATTCEVAQNNKDIVVYLETVGTNTLALAGAEAGKKPFSINITGCGNQETVGVAFETAEGVPSAAGTLPNVAPLAGRAANVDVALYHSGNGADMRINLNSAGPNMQVVQTSGGAATLGYAAGYYATGAAGAGAVKGLAKFSIIYQ